MQITVVKNDHLGNEILRYTGTVIERQHHMICLDAVFSRGDVVTSYATFSKGDRMREWFYSDRWYNIFELHAFDDDRLKGWYCNITRPALFEDGCIIADDLALDLFITPQGKITLLDVDEFQALNLSTDERTHAQNAVEMIKQQVLERMPPFDVIEVKRQSDS